MHPTTRVNRYADQRRASRTRVHFPARYVSSNLNLEGHVTDLSPDGLFFCSDFLDDQGETAQVQVMVPARNEPITLRGEVRWVKDPPHARRDGPAPRRRQPRGSRAPHLVSIVPGKDLPLPSGNA